MDEHPLKIRKWLYPISFLYGIGVRLRNMLFDRKILRSESFDIPVISIGNIAVGGTGKTPHTEYLISFLQNKFQVAVLSRGYKRESLGYMAVTSESTARTVGDELYQIKKKYPNCYVAADADRRHGIGRLCRIKEPKAEVILLDDAYQHRYVQAGVTILLTDYNRLFCDDALLPAGYLREPESGKSRADMVIVTKCPEYISPIDYNIIIKRLGLYPYQQLYFSTFEYGDLIPVFPEAEPNSIDLAGLTPDTGVLLVTGIASPATIIRELSKYTSRTDVISFADHHKFTERDMHLILRRFEALAGTRKLIITTEKDAARLVGLHKVHSEIKKHTYALPVAVKIMRNQQNTFEQNIISYVRKNKHNSLLPDREDR